MAGYGHPSWLINLSLETFAGFYHKNHRNAVEDEVALTFF